MGPGPLRSQRKNESCFIPRFLHSSHYAERAPQWGARAVIFLLQCERFICLTNQFFGTDFPACILFSCFWSSVCLFAILLALVWRFYFPGTLCPTRSSVFLSLPLSFSSLILVSLVIDRTQLPHASKVETLKSQGPDSCWVLLWEPNDPRLQPTPRPLAQPRCSPLPLLSASQPHPAASIAGIGLSSAVHKALLTHTANCQGRGASTSFGYIPQLKRQGIECKRWLSQCPKLVSDQAGARAGSVRKRGLLLLLCCYSCTLQLGTLSSEFSGSSAFSSLRMC